MSLPGTHALLPLFALLLMLDLPRLAQATPAAKSSAATAPVQSSSSSAKEPKSTSLWGDEPASPKGGAPDLLGHDPERLRSPQSTEHRAKANFTISESGSPLPLLLAQAPGAQTETRESETQNLEAQRAASPNSETQNSETPKSKAPGSKTQSSGTQNSGTQKPSAQLSAAAGEDDPELRALLAPVAKASLELRSWDEAMELLRRHSTDERIALAAIERAEGQWTQALSALLPNARFNAQVTLDVLNPSRPTFGQVGVGGGGSGASNEPVPTAPLGMASISLTQNILNLGSNAGLKAAKAQEDSAKATLADVRRRTTLGLVNAIVAVVAAERTAELNRLGLTQALERLELTQKSFSLGAATRLDLYRVQQDAALARSALIAGDERLRQSRDALGIALGLDRDVGVAPSFGLEGLVSETQDRCSVVDGWESRPDLIAAQKQVDAAEAGIGQAKAGYLPTLGLQSNISALTTSPGPGRVALWSLALVLNVPIWEGGLRSGQIAERSALAQQSKEQAEQHRRQVAIEVSRARRGVEVAENLLDAARDARTFASSTDELTQRSFEVGRATSLELVQSAVALRQADLALATSEYDFVRARLDAYLTEATCEW